MKYPKTPREKWLTVKVTPDDVRAMQNLWKKGGLSLSHIGRLVAMLQIDRKPFCHHTVQRYVDPERYALYRSRRGKNVVQAGKTKAYAKRAKARKLELMAGSLKGYQKHYWKQNKEKINAQKRKRWERVKERQNRLRRERHSIAAAKDRRSDLKETVSRILQIGVPGGYRDRQSILAE